MTPISLKKFLSKEGGSILSRLLALIDEPISVLDIDGNLLVGEGGDAQQGASNPIPILHEGQPVGWVQGEASMGWRSGVAALLEFMLAKESEKRDLAAEVLSNYRELHLLYRLSEKLVASPQPEMIAQTALAEVCTLIRVTGGMVVLKQEDREDLETVTTCGFPYQLKPDIEHVENLVEHVIQTGIAEISNDVIADQYFVGMQGIEVSLLCAPFKTDKRIIGAIILVGAESKQFTAGDLKLVNAIALQTAPAIEIAYLHQVELQKTRMERDLKVARDVQASLLPNAMPEVEGWQVAAFWQPARQVSGDFYEFFHFSDGRLGLTVADVSDKGMPAALVMANTRSVMRTVAAITRRGKNLSPARLLQRVNRVLCEDMPMHMFVTCLLVILDPQSGRISYSNAGHNLAILRTPQGVTDLHASGFPLGIFPDAEYEDKEAVVGYGDSLLLYSDGLVEAHNPYGDMFGFDRLRRLLAYQPGVAPLRGEALMHFLMAQLAEFTGSDWEQEDDVTLVTLDRP